MKIPYSIGLIFAFLSLPVLAGDYEDGRVSYKAFEYEKASIFFKKCADAGNVECQRELSKVFAIGRYWDSAYKYALMAAEKGDAFSMNYVGGALISGKIGVKENKAEGLAWVKKSAELGDRNGLHHLGFLHDGAKFMGMGQLLETDSNKARAYYLRAAALGNYSAIFNLRSKYKINSVEWLMWHILAAAGTKNIFDDGGTQDEYERHPAIAKKELSSWKKDNANRVEYEKAYSMAEQWSKENPEANIEKLITFDELSVPRGGNATSQPQKQRKLPPFP